MDENDENGESLSEAEIMNIIYEPAVVRRYKTGGKLEFLEKEDGSYYASPVGKGHDVELTGMAYIPSWAWKSHLASVEGEKSDEKSRQFDELLAKEMARSKRENIRYEDAGGVLIYKFMKRGKERSGKELSIVEIINEGD